MQAKAFINVLLVMVLVPVVASCSKRSSTATKKKSSASDTSTKTEASTGSDYTGDDSTSGDSYTSSDTSTSSGTSTSTFLGTNANQNWQQQQGYYNGGFGTNNFNNGLGSFNTNAGLNNRGGFTNPYSNTPYNYNGLNNNQGGFNGNNTTSPFANNTRSMVNPDGSSNTARNQSNTQTFADPNASKLTFRFVNAQVNPNGVVMPSNTGIPNTIAATWIDTRDVNASAQAQYLSYFVARGVNSLQVEFKPEIQVMYQNIQNRNCVVKFSDPRQNESAPQTANCNN